MKKILLLAKTVFALLLITASAITANASAGAPHSVTATANYNTVQLNWEAPSADIKLKWHNEYDYNAADGRTYNSKEMTAFYVSNYFTAEDLKNVVGKQVKSISYMQYRAVYKVTALVYVNDKVVSTGIDDQSAFKSGIEKEIMLDAPVTIPEGASMRFAVKFECGSNMDMVASRDNGPTVIGKGDCISYDGETWISDNGGNFWVTARLVNDATETAEGYNVYCDGVKIASDITDTEYTVANAVSGRYYITAVSGISESAESNAIVYNSGSDGVDNIDADSNNITYNATTKTIYYGTIGNIDVYTTSGALVKSAIGVSELNISELSNGVYIAKITVDGTSATIKIAK